MEGMACLVSVVMPRVRSDDRNVSFSGDNDVFEAPLQTDNRSCRIPFFFQHQKCRQFVRRGCVHAGHGVVLLGRVLVLSRDASTGTIRMTVT